MAWLYVPGFPASNSDSRSQSLPTELSLRWRAKRLPLQSWLRVRKTVPWTRFLFGTISRPSTAALGVERWIASLRGCRVSLTQSPGNGSDTTTSEPSGRMPSESFPKCDPPWSSSKTSQGSFSFFDPSERLYQAWVTSLREDYSRRRKSAPATDGNGSSSWPTPNAHDGRRPGVDDKSTQGVNLQRDAAAWPTPTVEDARSSGAAGYSTENRHAGTTLTDATCRSFLQDRESVTPGNGLSGDGRRLNPLFVEWLMGLPPGWTSFERLEIAFYLSQQRGRLRSLLEE